MATMVGPPESWQWISNRPTAIKTIGDLNYVHWPEDCEHRFRELCDVDGHHDDYCQAYRASEGWPDRPEHTNFEPLLCMCNYI